MNTVNRQKQYSSSFYGSNHRRVVGSAPKSQNLFRGTENRYLDTCEVDGRKVISKNLLTPKDRTRANYERLRYELAVWKCIKEEESSIADAIKSLVVIIITAAVMIGIFTLIN